MILCVPSKPLISTDITPVALWDPEALSDTRIYVLILGKVWEEQLSEAIS
jgi:hypothetical protein